MKPQKIKSDTTQSALPDWPPEAGFRSFPLDIACLTFIHGKQLGLYNGDNAILFRYVNRNSVGWTYFMYDSAERNAYRLEAAWFTKQYEAKQFGRVIAVPVTAEPDCDQFELLYFRTDGTGFIWPGMEQTEFSWASLWEWPVDPLWESFELMSSLGRIVFDNFNATLKNPLIDPSALEDEPLEFINGSQEELETITRWICHSGAGASERRSGWSVTYSAPGVTRNKGGGLLEWAFSKSASLQELFNLAYEYNPFTGYHWEYNDEKVGHQYSYDPQPLRISFEFRQPSHDEQRAAKQELRRWLGGKMTATEIQHLLGRADTP